MPTSSSPSVASSQTVSRACFFQSTKPSTVSASFVAAFVTATQRASSPSRISLIPGTRASLEIPRRARAAEEYAPGQAPTDKEAVTCDTLR